MTQATPKVAPSTPTGFRPAVSVPAAAALALPAAAAWAVLARGATGHMSHHTLLGAGHLPPAGALLAFLANWQIMILATTLPAALPAIATRRADRSPATFATVIATIAALCTLWTGWLTAVLAGDLLVHRLVNGWPWLAERDWLVTSAVLTLAGAVHLAPLRTAAQAPARNPLPWGHAVACLRGCWGLMLVMFAVALDSLLWMSTLTAVMTAHTMPRLRPRLAPAVGAGLIYAAMITPLHSGGV